MKKLNFSLNNSVEHNVFVIGKKYIKVWIKIYFLTQQVTLSTKEEFLKVFNDIEEKLGKMRGYSYVLKQINEIMGIFKPQYIIKGSNSAVKICCSTIFKQMSKYPVYLFLLT